MFETMFTSVLAGAESTASTMSMGAFLACSVTSLVLGLVIAVAYQFRHHASKSFLVTLALLPVVVQVVITLVNGNIGAGVAVMGVFSLVRFRSIPGSAKDICMVFLAMAVGLASGMGFLGLAAALTAIVCLANVAYMLSPLGRAGERSTERSLLVKIPEHLDYYGIFDDLFDSYTKHAQLNSVRTTNMGSLYELHYQIELRDASDEKRLLDAIRTRNGNLTVQCGRFLEANTL